MALPAQEHEVRRHIVRRVVVFVVNPKGILLRVRVLADSALPIVEEVDELLQLMGYRNPPLFLFHGILL